MAKLNSGFWISVFPPYHLITKAIRKNEFMYKNKHTISKISSTSKILHMWVIKILSVNLYFCRAIKNEWDESIKKLKNMLQFILYF